MFDKMKSLIESILDFTRKMRDDFVTSFAAQGAFFIIISAFPFTMFLLTLIQYLPITESNLLDIVNTYIPDTFSPYIITIITEIYKHGSSTVISVTAITALWSASRGFFAIMKGLNTIYGIQETRNYFKIRFLAFFYTFVFALMLIGTLLLLVFGNSLLIWIESRLPALTDVALLLISIRTFVVLLVLLLLFSTMYLFIPNRKSRFMKELPGAFISAAGWMIFSYGFSYYIDHMKNFTNTYGSLTAAVLLMLWLYFCMYILFFGGEINYVLDKFTNKDSLT
ncbi:YihY/virulence factor BrkB family protein [[Clostridium] polysaccharolyticum]|uniref:Membrane protein n=1 Tax=[Clostridium] polysaccharolyticum TaxID=29364 RepID=A0A1H9ZFG6_9FIRM|nr:YihY/virulence factor BrkB family protein [[Clostridium] polysaccharolyticum]SES79796.1 membrane protein [[Clostridium] polysaccharolyticum]